MSKQQTSVNPDNNKDWPLGEAQRVEPQNAKWYKRCSNRLRRWITQGLSNLRLSLTLRIALHYSAQLFKTTLPAIAAVHAVLVIVFYPSADLDRLCMMQPQDGSNFTQQQLSGMPFSRARLEKDGFSGIGARIGIAFSDFQGEEGYQILLAENTPYGCVIAAWQIDELLSMMHAFFWTLLVIDLFRAAAFMKQRNRLNHKVLKPITDMAEKAATLSASNLSDRISVEGAKNELKDLALVINGMLDRIEVSYNSQKQFVSDASHELRTPIAVIQGYVGMLQRWGKDDKNVLNEGIAAIAQEASSMKELVERLLFLARHDKKTLMLEMQEFDPLEIMSEIHREAKMLSNVHSFELTPVEHARINGDKDMIKQLMRILLDNAIKYTPSGGKITLGVQKEKDCCVLSVSDTGAGISAEDLPKVFERFYRCDDARKMQTSGHGLGLSIARIIVSAHKGNLKVRSKVGAGTVFSVQLPLDNESIS